MTHGTPSGYSYHKCRCNHCIEAMRSSTRKWRRNNRNRSRELSKRWRVKNPLYLLLWKKRNPHKQKIYNSRRDKDKLRIWFSNYVKFRIAHDKNFKLRRNLANRLWDALRRSKSTKCGSTTILLGCSISDFRIYMESKFEIGMSWENYGTVWEIDHIMPCAIFDLSKPEHQKRCFHFSNMQPLFKSDNRKKWKHVPTQTNIETNISKL